MVLRVLPVPVPAVGTDWSFRIPAQWTLDVVAVQATLNTPANITSFADSTVNNHPLTISPVNAPGVIPGQPGPFGGTPNLALRTGPGSNANGGLRTGLQALYATAVWSADAWYRLDGNAVWAGNANNLYGLSLGFNSDRWSVFMAAAPATPQDFEDLNGATGIRHKFANFSRGVWHHVAFTWDGANVLQYHDGALVITWGPDSTVAGGTNSVLFGTASSPLGTFTGLIAGAAQYGVTLTPAQIATHAASAGTSAGYKAAVLADAPLGLWMLDDLGANGTRAAALRLTDGTTELARYPGGTISGHGSALSWCWQSQAPGTSQSADGLTTLVQIPDLVLPGGYVLGTVTPDLTGVDQWTNINIWWNDTTSYAPGAPGGSPSQYVNAYLVPDYSHRG